MSSENPQFVNRRQGQENLEHSDRRGSNRRIRLVLVEVERRKHEKRRSARKPFTAQVSLVCNDAQIECVPKDINVEGLNVTIENMPDLLAVYLVKIGFYDRVFFEIPARILHSQEIPKFGGYEIGLQFSAISVWEKNLLANLVSGIPLEAKTEKSLAWKKGPRVDQLPQTDQQKKFYNSLNLSFFPLLVNGKKLDTGISEFFPHAEKLIADRRKTMWMLNQLKSLKTPPNYQEHVFGRYCVGDEATNLEAIRFAYKASLDFRYWDLEKRRKIMVDVHSRLLSHREKIINLMVVEGHPVDLATWEYEGMEVGLRNEALDFYVSKLSEHIKPEGTEKLSLKRRADGVVALVPPKNASCSSSLIGVLAILAGNSLIIKPPLKNPVATMYLWNEVVHPALVKNKVPGGVLNIVMGNSNKIMEEWIESPFVNDIIYFGESDSGIEVGKRIYAGGKKPILELSGSDLLFVWSDASLEKAVDALMDGFLGSTQICMVPKKAVIHEDIYEKFKTLFVEKAQKLRPGLPIEKGVILSPVTKIPKFFKYLKNATEKGAKLLCGGERVDFQGRPDRLGVFITPTVLEVEDVEKALDMDCVIEENFFPMIPLIKVKAGSLKTNQKENVIFQKMVSLCNSHPFGLRVSVWTQSKDYKKRFVKYFHNSGILRINSRHIDFSLCLASHGGTKKSGGPFGEMNYIWQKTTHLQGISVSD